MTNDNTKHTPLPWGVDPDADFDGERPGIQSEANGYYVCELSPNMPGGIEERLANAEFIARACNAHGNLVQALRDLLEYPENGTPLHPGALVWETARAALDKAAFKPISMAYGREVAP